MEGNDATVAKIAVWWDMKDCPIPEGYDVCRVRPSIERALKKRGYSDPVSITAYGNQKQTSDHLLRGLSSTGVVVAHAKSESTCSLIFSDMLEWRARNPPPATMMLISNQVKDVFYWDLARLQQETKFNLFLAFSRSSCNVHEILDTVAKWRWKELLGSVDNEHEEIICRETSTAMFYCKSCNLVGQSLVKFRKHLSSTRHALKEIINPTAIELDPVTRKWARNYQAKPEYATANIGVWWDMRDCPTPVGYDPRWVRPSIEGACKHLGYSGPVSISAYADLTQTPDHILQGLSSTGVDVTHTHSYKRSLYDAFSSWQDHNPPPATMMVISDQLEDQDHMSWVLEMLQRQTKYNLFVAYSYRPYKMPVLVTSAEWLWESLLAGHHPETRRHVLQKCSGKGQSTGMFYCKSCYFDCKSLDNLRKHLSSKEHASEEAYINRLIEFRESERDRMQEEEYFKTRANFPRSKRSRKAFRTGFHHFHNHLHMTNRGARHRARKL